MKRRPRPKRPPSNKKTIAGERWKHRGWPTTRRRSLSTREKNAEGWYEYLKKPSGVTDDGVSALTALKEEGVPFLLALLSETKEERYHTAYLFGLKPEYIHPNDLPKLIDCLNKKWSEDPRILALTDLSRRKESRAYYNQIADAVKDIRDASNINGNVRVLLESIHGK